MILSSFLPLDNTAMPAAVPRYQEPIEGEIFHFREHAFLPFLLVPRLSS